MFQTTVFDTISNSFSVRIYTVKGDFNANNYLADFIKSYHNLITDVLSNDNVWIDVIVIEETEFELQDVYGVYHKRKLKYITNDIASMMYFYN